MSKKNYQEFKVKIVLPPGMGNVDMKEYIHEAVSRWGGQFEPGIDPRFDIMKQNVKVTKIAAKKETYCPVVSCPNKLVPRPWA